MARTLWDHDIATQLLFPGRLVALARLDPGLCRHTSTWPKASVGLSAHLGLLSRFHYVQPPPPMPSSAAREKSALPRSLRLDLGLVIGPAEPGGSWLDLPGVRRLMRTLVKHRRRASPMNTSGLGPLVETCQAPIEESLFCDRKQAMLLFISLATIEQESQGPTSIYLLARDSTGLNFLSSSDLLEVKAHTCKHTCPLSSFYTDLVVEERDCAIH